MKEIKVKEVSASYKGSKNYNSVEISMTADITKSMDPDAAAATLLGKCMNLVSKKLSELPGEKEESKEEPKLTCSNCKKAITKKIYDYSMKYNKKALCYDCQKLGDKGEKGE